MGRTGGVRHGDRCSPGDVLRHAGQRPQAGGRCRHGAGTDPVGTPEDRSRGIHDRSLHLIGRRAGMVLQHECGDAGDDGGGLRAARAEEALLVDIPLGVHQIGIATRCPKADDVGAGSRQVGSAAIVAPARERRGGQPAAFHRQRADREDERVRRRRDESGGIVTVVAGCRDDDDAGVPRALDGCVQRLLDVRIGAAGAERQVDHADPEVCGVRDDPLDPGQQARRIDGTIPTGDLDGDDPGVGSDTADRSVGAPSGDDSCEVGAVPVSVGVQQFDVALVGAEIDARDHPVGERRNVGDAGVDDRDGHAGARDAAIPHGAGAHQVGDAFQFESGSRRDGRAGGRRGNDGGGHDSSCVGWASSRDGRINGSAVIMSRSVTKLK